LARKNWRGCDVATSAIVASREPATRTSSFPAWRLEVSILIATVEAAGRHRGAWPRSKVSMMIMRPPQQRQGCSGVGGCSIAAESLALLLGFGTASWDLYLKSAEQLFNAGFPVGAAAREWLAPREAALLPVPYYHVVFTLPAAIADIAYQNKAVIYDLLFKASAETLITIATDPKHLGARVGVLSVLHTWGSALTHHPHVHMIVPGSGISLDGTKWVAWSAAGRAERYWSVASYPPCRASRWLGLFGRLSAFGTKSTRSALVSLADQQALIADSKHPRRPPSCPDQMPSGRRA
jgi:hypothetical protein